MYGERAGFAHDSGHLRGIDKRHVYGAQRKPRSIRVQESPRESYHSGIATGGEIIRLRPDHMVYERFFVPDNEGLPVWVSFCEKHNCDEHLIYLRARLSPWLSPGIASARVERPGDIQDTAVSRAGKRCGDRVWLDG